MYRFYTKLLLIGLSLILSRQVSADDYKARKADIAPIINGLDDDACWSTVNWSVLDQIWVPAKGTAGTPDDFTGHYKAVWTEDKLYVFMRTTDDTLINWHPNDPLNSYWNNDCPEIFLDENRSKGDHQCNYNAFAYHISTLFQAIDSDPACKAQVFNDVITGARTRIGNTYYWEFAINVYTDQYKLNATGNPKAKLFEGKVLGFSIAYNDSDQNQTREKMYGSQVISAADPNVSYINADYFGTMELVGSLTAVSDEINSDQFSLYPNPVTDKLNIDFGGEFYNKLLLSDPAGKVKRSFVITGSKTFVVDLNGVQAGIYFLQLTGNTGSRIEKIVVP